MQICLTPKDHVRYTSCCLFKSRRADRALAPHAPTSITGKACETVEAKATSLRRVDDCLGGLQNLVSATVPDFLLYLRGKISSEVGNAARRCVDVADQLRSNVYLNLKINWRRSGQIYGFEAFQAYRIRPKSRRKALATKPSVSSAPRARMGEESGPCAQISFRMIASATPNSVRGTENIVPSGLRREPRRPGRAANRALPPRCRCSERPVRVLGSPFSSGRKWDGPNEPVSSRATYGNCCGCCRPDFPSRPPDSPMPPVCGRRRDS